VEARLAVGFALGVKGFGGVFSILARTASRELSGAFTMAMGTFRSRYRLPQKYCTEIGRIITRFAALEAKLSYCAIVIMKIGKKEGRVAVRMGRVESALTVIQDLLTIHKLEIPTDISKLKQSFKKLENARDLLSHGLWVYHTASKIPVIQHTSGNYPDPDGSNTSVRARIDPRGLEVPIKGLRDTVRAIDMAVKNVNRIGKEIDAAMKTQRQQASRGKRPPRSPRRRTPDQPH